MEDKGRWRVGFPRASVVTSVAFVVLLLVIEGVTAAESARGLVAFGRLVGIAGRAAWGVPATLDGVAVVSALLALRAELEGEGSAAYRVTLYVATAASVAANSWHGDVTGSLEAALYLGGVSFAVAWLFGLFLRQLRRKDRQAAGRVTARRPKFSAAHWLRFPRLTWTAWSLAVRDGHETAAAALAAARQARAAGRVLLPPVPTDAELAELPKADAIRLALAYSGGNVLGAVEWLAARGVTADRSYVHDVKRGVSGHRRQRREAAA